MREPHQSSPHEDPHHRRIQCPRSPAGAHRDIGAGESWWLTSLAYTSDASMIGAAVRRNHGGGAQLWLQPLAGGEPVPLTKFKRGTIGSYGWTPDGKLAYIRTESRGDVVVFEGL